MFLARQHGDVPQLTTRAPGIGALAVVQRIADGVMPKFTVKYNPQLYGILSEKQKNVKVHA